MRRKANGFEDAIETDTMCQDLIYAFRILKRSPGFSLVAIVSLALGVGVNGVVFGVTNSVLLRPLPIAAPNQVVFVEHNGSTGESYPNYKDIRDSNTVFSSLAMYRIAPMSLDTGGNARRVWGYLVTGNYFEMLGIHPAAGRFFGPAEDAEDGGSPVAVLSYDFWKRQFQADPGIVGRTVRINTHPYTVVGIAPEQFRGLESWYRSDIWLPLSMQSQVEGYPWTKSRNNLNGWVAGRIKSGLSTAQVNQNLQGIADELAARYRNNEGMRLSLSRPGLAGSFRQTIGSFAAGIMILASLVLLASCTNIASLLSARLTDRKAELSIRLAIGAGRLRIARQLLTECLLISLAGGLLGTAVASLLLDVVTQRQFHPDVPVQFAVNAGVRVFGFMFVLSLLTAGLFGILPTSRVWRSDPNQNLRGAGTRGPHRRVAARDIILIAQVAMCCALVTASIVAVRGLLEATRIHLGFQPAGISVAGYDVGQSAYTEQQGRDFQRRALQAVLQLPGVQAAAYSDTVPLNTDQSTTRVYPESTTDLRPKNSLPAQYYDVSPGYFATMGTSLIQGRDFTSSDTAMSPRVAVVNETFARWVLGPANWVGKRFRGLSSGDVEVIGVVENGKYESLNETPKAALFLPIEQNYSRNAMLLARSSRREADLAMDMRRVLTSIDPAVPVYEVGSLSQLYRFVFLPISAATIALSAFGILAVMLAVTGIYGVASYSVAQRTREIGIRVAIGAQRRNVICLIFGRTAVLMAAGCVIGLILSAMGADVLSKIVLGTSTRDPLVFVISTAAMILIGVASTVKPLRRALRMDAMYALRHE